MCTIHHLHYILKTKPRSTISQCATAAAADDDDRGFVGEVGDCGGDDDDCVGVEDFDNFPCLGTNFGSICRRRISFCSFKQLLIPLLMRPPNSLPDMLLLSLFVLLS